MSKTLREVRDSVLVALHKYSDDVRIPKSFIDGKIKDARVTLIKDHRKRNKGKVEQGFYQLINGLEIKNLVNSKSTSVGMVSGYYVNVPGIMKIVDNPVLSIGSHNMEVLYDIVPYIKWLTARYRRHTKHIPVGTVIDEMIVFHIRPAGNLLTSLILLEDFRSGLGFTDNSQVPVPSGILVKLEAMVVDTVARSYGLLLDPVNDDSEETKKDDKDSRNK